VLGGRSGAGEVVIVKVKLFFAWYDCWVGWYYDRRAGDLYVCPLPMVVFRFSPRRKAT
jgi:hypothetical protein